MSAPWATIAAVAVAGAAIKAAGPVLLGGRELPPRALAVIALLAPALLTALVMVETFSDGQRLSPDPKVAGVLAAGTALALRAPMLLAVAVAAVVTALIRALG